MWAAQNNSKGHKWAPGRTLDTPDLGCPNFCLDFSFVDAVKMMHLIPLLFVMPRVCNVTHQECDKPVFCHLFTTGSETECTFQRASGRNERNQRYLSHAVQETLHFYDPLVSFCDLGLCGPDVPLGLFQTPDVVVELSLRETENI